MFDTALTIDAVRAHLFRAKSALPMTTSFGTLYERPMLLVEVDDRDGARGWGEVWCNFPAFAAENRARFLQKVIAPMFTGTRLHEPAEAGRQIDRTLGVQAIQAGEQGLVAAVAAGLDQALWDLLARRHGLPLWRALGGHSSVRVYGSGIDPDQALETVGSERVAGHRALKLKVGFSDRLDLEAVAATRETLGDTCQLMVDANQAWSPRQAVEVSRRLEPFRLEWLEEPIRMDEPLRVWRELADRCRIPLAAGENIRDANGFSRLIDARLVRQVQPDVGKWGGITGCLAIGRRVVDAGLGYSPHWVAGGVGLAVSLNLLGAVGGDGLAEIDVNPNPLRDAFPLPIVREGRVDLAEDPGFGFVPDLKAIDRYRLPVD